MVERGFNAKEKIKMKKAEVPRWSTGIIIAVVGGLLCTGFNVALGGTKTEGGGVQLKVYK